MKAPLSFTTALSALALALAGFAAPGVATAQDTAPETEAQNTAETAAELKDVDPALWVVSDEDTTIYLFGTVHFLPPNYDWFNGPIRTAYDASDELVFEIANPDQAAAMQFIAANARNPEGVTVRSLMSEENRAEYEALIAQLGLPPAQLDPLEPWFAAMTIAQLGLITKGYSPDSGADKILMETAEADGKAVIGLETVEYQLGLFDGLETEQQLDYLDTLIEDYPDVAETFDELLATWAEGDMEAMVEFLISQSLDEELNEILIFNRNANWAEWIESRLEQPGTVFLAVGAAHLAGHRSVQALLEEQDIESTRIAHDDAAD